MKIAYLRQIHGALSVVIASCCIPVGYVDSQEATTANRVRFEVFVRGDLPAAEEVATYTTDLQKRVPGLEIVTYDVLENREQLIRLHALSKKFGRDKAVVPAFYCCNRMYFGFLNGEKSGPAVEALYSVDVYTRATCSRCQAAKRFIPELQKRWPAIKFNIFEITVDQAARQRWETLCRANGALPGLPTFDFAGQVIIGYQGENITGAQLERLIESVAGSDKPAQEAEKTKAKDDVGTSESSRPAKAGAPTSFLFSTSMATFGILAAAQDQPSEREPEASSPQDLAEFELPVAAEEEEIGEGVAEQTEQAVSVDPESIRVPFLGTLRVSELGFPAFTFLVGLIDGFNPCAMWILVFLLSVLVNVRDRRKILVIAGTFVVVSGIAYFAFMAAWLNLFMLIGIARPVQVALGLLAIFVGVVNVKDFFAFKKGISLSIPESSKQGLYRRVRDIVNAKYLTIALSGAISLAIVVNLLELLCTAGLPALYTQILTLQEMPVWKNYLYLALYILAYMLDDSLLLGIVVITLSHRRLQEREGRWLKLLSGIVILALGLVMILRPEWLQIGE